jgi:hypothetical protein
MNAPCRHFLDSASGKLSEDCSECSVSDECAALAGNLLREIEKPSFNRASASVLCRSLYDRLRQGSEEARQNKEIWESRPKPDSQKEWEYPWHIKHEEPFRCRSCSFSMGTNEYDGLCVACYAGYLEAVVRYFKFRLYPVDDGKGLNR